VFTNLLLSSILSASIVENLAGVATAAPTPFSVKDPSFRVDLTCGLPT
jgi:hypothetical protein